MLYESFQHGEIPLDSLLVFRGREASCATTLSIQECTAFQSSLFTSMRGTKRLAPSSSSLLSTALPHAQKCVYDLRASVNLFWLCSSPSTENNAALWLTGHNRAEPASQQQDCQVGEKRSCKYFAMTERKGETV